MKQKENHEFSIGDIVEKYDTRPGHQYRAEILACFHNKKGKAKYVAECNKGVLHILSGDLLNLVKHTTREGKNIQS